MRQSTVFTEPVRKAAVVKSEGAPSYVRPLNRFDKGTVGVVASAPSWSCIRPDEPFLVLFDGEVFFLNAKVKASAVDAAGFTGRPLAAHEYVELRNV